MKIVRFAVACSLLASGCAASTPGTSATSSTASPPPPTSTSTTTPTTTTIAPTDLPVCLAGSTEFVTEGLVATLGATPGDAAAIGGIRWAAHDGCERIVIDLLTAAGAPALRLGESSVAFRAELGVVRVELPVRSTAVADTTIEGEIVERVFVVRTGDGDLAVDVHLGTDEATMVRSLEIGAPSRVIVDLAPADEGMGRIAGPRVGATVVVSSPLGGPAEYPLVIIGYARTFEANVVAELRQGEEVVASTFTTAADSVEAWGEFELTIDSGPPGDSRLFVGEYDARDGSPVGVELQLDMS